MRSQIRPALVCFLMLTLITGVAYPLLITAIAQLVFPHQANGSLVLNANGKPIGSELIGQWSDDPRYFWPRPSATSPVPYSSFNGEKGTSSTGSNLAETNPALLQAVKDRVEALHRADPSNQAPIPVDLVTASASGLDPHLSPAAAEYQVARVARLRAMSDNDVRSLVSQCTEGRQLGLLGEPRVNVLQLNLALDSVHPAAALEKP